MKTTHDTSQVIGHCHDRIAAEDPGSVTEFFRNLLSPNQDFELNTLKINEPGRASVSNSIIRVHQVRFSGL